MQLRIEEGVEVSGLLKRLFIVVEGLAKPAEMVRRAAEVAVLIHDPEVLPPLVVLGKF